MQHRIYNTDNREYVEFYKDIVDSYRWRIVGGNGETVAASSEGFANKQNALDNLKLTLRIGADVLATLPSK